MLQNGYDIKGSVFGGNTLWGLTAPIVAARTGHFEEGQRIAKQYQAWLSERKIKYGLMDYGLGITEAGLGNDKAALHCKHFKLL